MKKRKSFRRNASPGKPAPASLSRRSWLGESTPPTTGTLLGIFLLVAAFRVLITFLPSCSVDMGGYQSWSLYLADRSLLNWGHFYRDNHVVYAPFYMYFLSITGLVSKFIFHVTEWPKVPEFLVKLWSVGMDGVGMYFIYRVGKDLQKPKLGLLLGLAYALNPAVFFNSSIWGQFDGFTATLLLMCIHCFLNRRDALGFFVFMLACLAKPQAGLLLPIVLLLTAYGYRADWKVQDASGFTATLLSRFQVFQALAKRRNLIKSFHIFITTPAAYLLLTAPFYCAPEFTTSTPGKPLLALLDRLLWVPSLYAKTVLDYPYSAANSFNLWYLLGKQTIPDQEPILGLSAQAWGLGLVLICVTTLTTVLIIRNRRHPFAVYFASFLTLLGCFVFMTKMHERYMMPALIFATVALLWERRLWLSYLALSACSLANTWVIFEKLKTPNPWIENGNPFAWGVSAVTLLCTLFSLGYALHLALDPLPPAQPTPRSHP